MNRSSVSLVPALLLTFTLLISTAGALYAQSYTVKVATAPNGKEYLTDSNGMTLYYFTKDVSGSSVCTGGCSNAWPAFSAGTVSAPASVDASAFGTITRDDGTPQTTYNGWPLYYFAGDKAPGDMKGEDFRHVWYMVTVPSYTVMVATSPKLGNYLTDADGMSLYYFTKDSANKSVCEGNCAKVWPPFHASDIVAPAGVNPSDFGTITRPDGSLQSTYKGYPLYYWIKDKVRGDTTGQDVGHVWFVLDPANFHPGT